MNIFRKIFRNLGSRVWFIVTAVLLVVVIAANLVLTLMLPTLMDWQFGGDRSVKEGEGNEYYSASDGITDKDTAQAAGNALTQEICSEGFTLLKNEDNALPLAGSEKVSVFGHNSVDLVYGSSGSVGQTSDDAPTIFDSLEDAGFTCNPTLKSFYESSAAGDARPSSPSMSSNSIVTGFETGETPVSSYTDEALSSLSDYNDAAIVVISRTSGENYDLPTTMKDSDGDPVDGAASADDHYLELDQNEQDMLQLACENFDKVILLINSSTALELGFLDDTDDGDGTVNDYDYASNVQAAIWIGMPGEYGIGALGGILTGETNPSGALVDTYARDFMAIPAVENFSCNGESSPDAYTGVSSQYFIDYEESIYVGYRYFETRGETDGEDWYDANVVYPFGYGLSYTGFEWTVTNEEELDGASITADSEITVEVEVKNTGSVAGKDIVQVYMAAPYTSGGIAKASETLVGYAKTDLIEAGGTDTVTVTFDAYDFASYDYTDANSNGFSGYELEKGTYTLRVSENAHDAAEEYSMTVSSGITYAKDPDTGYAVGNRFDDIDDELGTVLERNDWDGTYPSMRSDSEKAATSDFSSAVSSTDSGNPLTAESSVVTENAAMRAPASVKSEDGLQLYEMIGADYADDENELQRDDPDEPYYAYGDNVVGMTGKEAWDAMVSRVTLSSIWELVSTAAFKTAAITYISKPETIDTDGPAGFTQFSGGVSIYDTCFYCSECVIAATWNDDLAYDFGVSLGDEGLIGYETSTAVTPYSGIYAPGVNIHRTPFGGRNAEYYSEDPVLNGKLAASVAQGAASRGVYTFAKHFAANDQETHRGGVCTWITEQAYREIYLKPFEIYVKEGQGTAVMTSFNRVGTTWTGGDYRLVTEVLRNEWGFKGMVLTDFATGQSHMNSEQMVYAGGDAWLDTISPTSWYSKSDDLDVYVLQEALLHILYTVANSNAMNGLGEGAIYSTQMAYWRIVLIVADVVIGVALVVWGVFAVRGALRDDGTKEKEPKAREK